MDFDAIQNIANLKAQLELQRELLKNHAAYSRCCDAGIAGSRSKGTYSDPVYAEFCKSENIKEKMRGDFIEYEAELNRALSELRSIDDIKVRNICKAKYLMVMTWSQVANYLGGKNTADSVKKAHDRYLVKHGLRLTKT